MTDFNVGTRRGGSIPCGQKARGTRTTGGVSGGEGVRAGLVALLNSAVCISLRTTVTDKHL